MRIGVDARILTGSKTGIYNYVYNFLNELKRIDFNNEYFLFSHKDIPFPCDGNKWHKVIGSGSRASNSKLWFNISMASYIESIKPDVMWYTSNLLPLNVSGKSKNLLTVHDLTYIKAPGTMAIKNFIFYKMFQKRSILKASMVIADSYKTLKDIEDHFGVDGRWMEVVYPSLGDCFFGGARSESIGAVKEKYGISDKYIFSVGTIEPRKNIDILLKAFCRLRESKNIKHNLVIAGLLGWKTGNISKLVSRLGLRDKVLFLGHVSDEDLVSLYKGAEIFTYISSYEGFGFPVVEAMASGVPVITSEGTSMAEISAGSAFLVIPSEIDEVADAMARLINDDLMRDFLVKKGLERSKAFRPGESSRKLLSIFKRLGNQK